MYPWEEIHHPVTPKWIQQVLDPPLNPRNIEKIMEAEINGRVFLEGAGNSDFFMRAGLSFGPVLTSRSWPKVSPVQLSRVS